jgi:thioredoxin reductase
MAGRTYEVVVIGAGFAGLAAAQVLGRAQRTVLVLGSGPTRNAEAEHAHNVLTRDGTPPGELIRLGRAEVEALPTVTFEERSVRAVESVDEGLHVRTSDGEAIAANAVLLATGARDVLPGIPGLEHVWGRRAHSCPFCDGAAYADRRVLVIADDARAAHVRPLLGGWTDQLTVADPSAVAALDEVDGDVVAHLADGDDVVADGVFVAVTPVPGLDCVAGLPLAHRGPFLAIDGEGRTTHPRLWAAGDCAWRTGDAGPGGQVIAAMAAGARAAVSIVFDLLDVEVPKPPPVMTPES